MGLKYSLKRSMEVMTREGGPGPGITWMALEEVGAATMVLRKMAKENMVVGESFIIVAQEELTQRPGLEILLSDAA